MTVAIVLCGSATRSPAASIDDLTFEIINEGTAFEVNDCNTSASGSLTIPNTYEGLPVTSIGDRSFEHCKALTRVTIPDSVVLIGAEAFYNCSKLTSVTIPESVTTVGNNSFKNCDALTRVTVPSSLTTIGSGAFGSCDSLTRIDVLHANPNYASVDGVLFNKDLTMLVQAPGAVSGIYIIPDSVSVIGISAFRDCVSLSDVIISGNVTTIGAEAFYNCSSLTSLTVPDSVTTIGSSAFDLCSGMITIKLPQDVVMVGGPSFNQCTQLQNIELPRSVSFIDDYAFLACSSLLSVVLPDWTSGIGEKSFMWCHSLVTFTIPDNVLSIGNSAFESCDSLIHVTVGEKVQWFGERSFYNCGNLQSVVFRGNAPQSVPYLTFGRNASTFTIYFYEGSKGFTIPTWKGHPCKMLALATDQDNDGIPNSVERTMRTNPLCAQDRFRAWVRSEGGGLQLHYAPHSDAVNLTVHCTDNLSLPIAQWPVIESLDFSGDASEQAAMLPAAEDVPMFYIIKLTANED